MQNYLSKKNSSVGTCQTDIEDYNLATTNISLFVRMSIQCPWLTPFSENHTFDPTSTSINFWQLKFRVARDLSILILSSGEVSVSCGEEGSGESPSELSESPLQSWSSDNVQFSTNRRCLWPRVSICERGSLGGKRERLKWKMVTMVAKWLTG